MKHYKVIAGLAAALACAGCASVAVMGHPPGDKVAVCHKGKNTIYVDDAAVKAHLHHGDYLGACR